MADRKKITIRELMKDVPELPMKLRAPVAADDTEPDEVVYPLDTSKPAFVLVEIGLADVWHAILQNNAAQQAKDAVPSALLGVVARLLGLDTVRVATWVRACIGLWKAMRGAG